MKNVIDFLSAAYPWVTMGLLVAVVLGTCRGEGKPGSKAGAGMCLGVAVGIALGMHHVATCMLAGYLIGYYVESQEK